MQSQHPMHHHHHSWRTTLSYFALIAIKIVVLFAYLPFADTSVSWSKSNWLYWIYEESLQQLISQDTFYLDVAEWQDAAVIFGELQKQWVVSSYEQPFVWLDIPYYRVEFSTDEDTAKRTIANLIQSSRLQSVEWVPIFEVQQFSRTGSVTRPLRKLNRKPLIFSIQSVREPDFEWQWYTDEIGLIPAQLSCVTMTRPKTKIAVIDNAFMTTHPNIAWSIRSALDVADGDASTIPPNFEPEWMHGSHSAWLIAGKKNKWEWIVGTSLWSAELYVFKATADNAWPTEITHGIEAFAKAIEMDVDIISLSWWAYMDFPVFRQVIKKALDKWIVVIAAAGNYWSEDYFYPAAYEWVISIWAYNKDMRRADFSNYGDRVDIYAPWVDLVVPVNQNEYASTDWTSSAAPLFAGVYSFLSRYLWINHPDLDKVLTKNNSVLWKYLLLSDLCPDEPVAAPIQKPMTWTNIIQEAEKPIDPLPIPLPIEPESVHEVAPETFMEQSMRFMKTRWWWIVAFIAMSMSWYLFWQAKKLEKTGVQ
jgi:Subtilase family